MPDTLDLCARELIDASQHWRRLAPAGATDIVDHARRREVQLRRRLGARNPCKPLQASGDGNVKTLSDFDLTLPVATDIADRFVIATAHMLTPSADALCGLLHSLRVSLVMYIAFVANRRIQRHIDPIGADELPVKIGDAGPQEMESCRRVVDGRLPKRLAEMRAEPLTAELLSLPNVPGHQRVSRHVGRTAR